MLAALIFLAVHFLADFVFQTSQMATNKSKSIKWLSIHVLTYTGVSSLSAGFIFFKTQHLFVAASWLLLNGILHFITDFFTSKWTSSLWAKNNMRGFFTVIGFDQLIHQVCLIGTYFYLIKLVMVC
jgi:hypothetical protein